MRSFTFRFAICLALLCVTSSPASASFFGCLGLQKQSGTLEARKLYVNQIRSTHQKVRARNRQIAEKIKAANIPTTKLKVATLNTGLLNAKVLGFVDISVPKYAERSAAYPSHIKSFLQKDSPDIFFLQEVWHPSDIAAIRREISGLGYEIVSSTQANDGWFPLGLHTVVKVGSGSKVVESNTNRSGPTTTKEKIAGIHRGSLSVVVQAADGTRLLLLNSHLTFAEGNTFHRIKQVTDMTDIAAQHEGKFDYLLMGSDTNSSDVFEPSVDNSTSKWYLDKEVYLTIDEQFNQWNLIDSYRALYPDDQGYTQDPVHNALTRESPTTRVEPRQRLDYVWAGSSASAGGIYATNSQIAFTRPMSNGINYSDHFGIESEFQYVPAQRPNN